MLEQVDQTVLLSVTKSEFFYETKQWANKNKSICDFNFDNRFEIRPRVERLHRLYEELVRLGSQSKLQTTLLSSHCYRKYSTVWDTTLPFCPNGETGKRLRTRDPQIYFQILDYYNGGEDWKVQIDERARLLDSRSISTPLFSILWRIQK